MQVATYMLDRHSTMTLINKILFEMLYGYCLDLLYLCIFRSISNIHIWHEFWYKLQAKAIKCIFIENNFVTMGYYCYNPVQSKVLINSNVSFFEYHLNNFSSSLSLINFFDNFLSLIKIFEEVLESKIEAATNMYENKSA